MSEETTPGGRGEMATASPRDFYLDQCRQMHDRGAFRGWTIRHYARRIDDLIEMHRPKTLLDYGCGKGEFHRKQGFGVPTTLYDPAWPPYATRPSGKFDGVLCVDVLEHVPATEIPALLDDVFGYARVFVFLTACTREAKKRLPNGENAHITVRPREWWWNRIVEADPGGLFVYHEFV